MLSQSQLRRSRRNRKTRYRKPRILNRIRQSGWLTPKTHWLDAACVGKSTPEPLIIEVTNPLQITAKGQGTRQMCGTNKYGIPIRHRSRVQIHKGFQLIQELSGVGPALGKTRPYQILPSNS